MIFFAVHAHSTTPSGLSDTAWESGENNVGIAVIWRFAGQAGANIKLPKWSSAHGLRNFIASFRPGVPFDALLPNETVNQCWKRD